MHTHTWVEGTPGPQGSKNGFVTNTGRVNMVESSKKVKPWRKAVVAAWKDKGPRVDMHTGPLFVCITFYLDRPKGHYRTGKYSHLLKESAPEYPAVKPDIDKLARSTLDGLTTAGAIEDDARIVGLSLAKRYTGPDVQELGIPGPGAEIFIRSGIDL